MNIIEKNEIVAHYYNELVFRARRVGLTITNVELTEYLGYSDSGMISLWLNNKRKFDEDRLAAVMQFIADREKIVGTKEMLNGLKELITFLDKE